LAVNCVGDFYGGAIYVAARHEGLDGDYVLAMYMEATSDDLRPRPVRRAKKLARSGLHRRGEQFNGLIERGGVRLMELRADLDEELGASEGEASTSTSRLGRRERDRAPGGRDLTRATSRPRSVPPGKAPVDRSARTVMTAR